MQLEGERYGNKHSLMTVMNRFIAAANNMDETIMVPTLLRDVPLEERASKSLPVNNNDNEPACPSKQRDMYEHYLLLKSIRNDMEWGLLQLDVGDGRYRAQTLKQDEDSCGIFKDDADGDLESQFHYHLQGLFSILSKLTVQADRLTNRYTREIGGGTFIRVGTHLEPDFLHVNLWKPLQVQALLSGASRTRADGHSCGIGAGAAT
ncbi:mid1-interacting protein 1-like [Arapaima gigas]